MVGSSQFAGIVSSYGGKVSKPKAVFREWLRTNGLSDLAIDVVLKHTLKAMIEVSARTFYSEKDVMSVNSEGAIPIAIRDGLLIVGTCLNGDPIAMDVRTRIGTVGLIGHGSMWQASSVRSVFIPLSETFGEFLASIDDDEFPFDYYEASARAKKA